MTEEQREKARESNRRRVRGRTREQKDSWNAAQRSWRAENPGYSDGWNARRRARKTGSPGHHTEAEWMELLVIYGGRCAYCGSGDRVERDHRTPLCRGGSDLVENLSPACLPCNRSKGRLTVNEFLDRRQSWPT